MKSLDTGTELTVSPAYGSLGEKLGKASVGLALPTIVSRSLICKLSLMMLTR